MNKYLKGKIVSKFGSQFEFARAIGQHEAVVSRIIRGHRELTPDERVRWAIALSCDDPERLFEKRDG
jgi:plasmid maintenance system antidote protein VapI